MDSMEREVGMIRGLLESVDKSIERLESKVDDYATIAREAITEHEHRDDERFDKLWEAVGKVSRKVAMYGGGLAVLATLIELLRGA